MGVVEWGGELEAEVVLCVRLCVREIVLGFETHEKMLDAFLKVSLCLIL